MQGKFTPGAGETVLGVAMEIAEKHGIPTTVDRAPGLSLPSGHRLLIRCSIGAQRHEQISKGLSDIGEPCKEMCDNSPRSYHAKN